MFHDRVVSQVYSSGSDDAAYEDPGTFPDAWTTSNTSTSSDVTFIADDQGKDTAEDYRASILGYWQCTKRRKHAGPALLVTAANPSDGAAVAGGTCTRRYPAKN